MSKTKTPKIEALFQPVNQLPEVPFALAEIVALTETVEPRAARLAESIFDLLLGFPSPNLLQLSDEAKQNLRDALGVVWQPTPAADGDSNISSLAANG